MVSTYQIAFQFIFLDGILTLGVMNFKNGVSLSLYENLQSPSMQTLSTFLSTCNTTGSYHLWLGSVAGDVVQVIVFSLTPLSLIIQGYGPTNILLLLAVKSCPATDR